MPYEQWLRAYLHFYRTLAPTPAVVPPSPPQLRGQVAQKGGLTPLGVDWQAQLVQTEARLLYQFHQWLRRAELFEIRATIAQAANTGPATAQHPAPTVDLYLVCASMELARLPWEVWEIGAEFGTSGAIRLARCPSNVRRAATGPRAPQQRLRILAILGDERGLDFQADCEALRLLSPLAHIQFVVGDAAASGDALKQQIAAALTDPRGWDLLFFAGHSEEMELTGGELAIAPGVKLQIQEIAPQLALAQQRGLQLAIFNSCCGLTIAAALIDLGVGQVVIMREPVPNRVAQTFLLRFLQHLLAGEDTHDALRSACQFLKLEQSLSLPSAYLGPSLFRHPQTQLLRLHPRGIKRWLRPWRPVRCEAITVGALLLLSLWPSVQEVLLEHRIWTQAVYRDLTGQVAPDPGPPPVLLVPIDEPSIQRAPIVPPNPMDRTYLAQLVGRLGDAEAQIIGIDYLLDRPHPKQDPVLAQAVAQAVNRQHAWFVFAALQDPVQGDMGVNPDTAIAPAHTTVQAHINALPSHVKLPDPGESCQHSCPFAYLLALIATYQKGTPALQPPLDHTQDLRTQLLADIDTVAPTEPQLRWLHQLRFHPVTAGASLLRQLWLRPILDFSIPPSQVYKLRPAWSVLAPPRPGTQVQSTAPVILIAPGGYDGAGISQPDDVPMPLAIGYWQQLRLTPPEDNAGSTVMRSRFTGGEAHAYMIHHLLTRHLVVPIPDAWLVLFATIVAKASVLQLRQVILNRRQRWFLTLGIFGGTGLYLLLSLQLYISATVLLPWLLPMGLIWLYILPMIWRNNHV